MLALVQHLEECIESLKIKSEKSNWISYAEENSYSAEAMNMKKQIISEWLKKIKPKTVLDFGCNTGTFSLLASKHCDYVLAMDSDTFCIEKLYSDLKKSNGKNILPLVMNLSNPSPEIGWANEERKTFSQRGKTDMLFALALIHHLRIGNNVPFSLIAKYFSEQTKNLIIEFVPKDDIRVKQMMAGRESIFDDYSEDNFKKEFEKYFSVNENNSLVDSGRSLYLMSKK